VVTTNRVGQPVHEDRVGVPVRVDNLERADHLVVQLASVRIVEICGSKRSSAVRGSATDRGRLMHATQKTTSKSLQTMPNTSKEKSNPTTANISGQDIQAHAGQSQGTIRDTIRPRRVANVGPTTAVQLPSSPIRNATLATPGVAQPPVGPNRHTWHADGAQLPPAAVPILAEPGHSGRL